MLTGKKILLGVSGGIAVYKAVALTSKLTQAGADVKVVMTKHATEFVTPLSFQALSRHEVYVDTFEEREPDKIAHIDLADWADIVLIAPATAHVLGRMANGLADDLLTTILLATQSPVYIAPAMNVHMYDHPAVQQNMLQLATWGYRFIEPGDGYLACGYVGKGRLEEPEEIIEVIQQHEDSQQQLIGKNVLVSAGPTQEAIDPVRYFSNYSSGKMGFAIAEAAYQQGANVTLVTGPSSLSVINQVERVDVTTTEEMYQEIMKRYDQVDIVIKAAAVADYRPKKVYDQKMKKQTESVTIELEKTRDILRTLGEEKRHQYLVGFAAESQNVRQNGEKKLYHKHLDAIVMNDISRDDIGFDADDNEVVFLSKSGKQKSIEQSSKPTIAKHILDLIARDWKDIYESS
ncbi:pantothenate metabolism [Gracilibacillus halophilus YIM-C55.5]|uniref:Coenzyme A biosynthesis bifunctional protein CoaBC n=1 Tax=Gracilibacillus halophilus YIM-C55.5 TaxID=1308866 RepID=N4WG92_9BACI|nr:bifunctional phosphopantothenoylcysteine decarboxylase/phosphopantothenate--cysteine ligase CoaBC [Gracilibacillus halophilus]ENH98289.1 pantothenate metabolism [Gracilibacillus halophilus YIM-C55.5]